MFCPKCATQNVDGASFCRVCGANISLVPNALSGQLPQPVEQDEGGVECFTGRKRRRREATPENAFRSAFMGVAFLIVAIALSFSKVGASWWFWMLIPAFSMMGTGVAQYIRYNREKRELRSGTSVRPVMQSSTPVDLFPERRTGELRPPPPSVTEGTTRHLGAEAPTRHLDASSESSK
jgi:hypothetical protein